MIARRMKLAARATRLGLAKWSVRFLPSRVAVLLRNPLFDRNWYLSQYGDVAVSGMDPERHYRAHGFQEERAPNLMFDTHWYVQVYPDVAAARLNPLDHYFLFGAAEGRNPSPQFDSTWYLETNDDVAVAGVNPLLHYLRHGHREGRLPKAPEAVTVGASLLTYPVHPHVPRRHEPSSLGSLAIRELLRRIPADSPLMVIIDDKYPRPERDAGSLEMANLVDVVRRIGYHVLYMPTSGDKNREARRRLEARGVTTIGTHADYPVTGILRALGRRVDVALLSRVDCGGTYLEDVHKLCPSSKVIFYPHDLHWIREEREASIHNDRIGWFLAMQTRERERYIARLADVVIVFSQQEAAVLNDEASGALVVWSPLIQDLRVREVTIDGRSGIAFVGGFAHPPNQDAVESFLVDTWPHLHSSRPDIQFFVVGPDLPREFQARFAGSFVYRGVVPDLNEVLSKVRLTIAPLRYGAGAKGKIVSSLAHGVPCVATAIGVEGMALGEDIVATARPGREFADAIVSVYDDREVWQVKSGAGLSFVERIHSSAAAEERLRGVLGTIGAPVPAPIQEIGETT